MFLLIYLDVYTVSFRYSFLTQCRPLSVGMGNTIKYLKLIISNMPANTTEHEVRKEKYRMFKLFI